MAGLLFMAGLGRTPLPCAFCSFVQSYKAVEHTSTPMHVWERVIFSAAIATHRAQ